MRMEKWKYGIYLLLAGIILMNSCRQPQTRIDRLLADAALRVDREPEQMRQLLAQQKDSAAHWSESQQIYYELLNLKAADKCYLPHTSDSLIQRIVAYYEQKGDPDKLREAYYYAGRVAADLNEAPDALEAFHKALAVEGGNKQYLLLSNIYSQIGSLYEKQNIYEDEALRMQRLAHHYTLLANDSASLFFTSRDIARIYKQTGRKDSAIIYYKQAIRECQAVHDEEMYHSLLVELSDALYDIGDYTKAKTYLYESMNDTTFPHLYHTFACLGELYLHTQQPDSASYYLHRCETSKNLYVLESIYQDLSILAERQGNDKEALHYARLHQAMQDSLRKQNVSEEIRKATALYNYQRKEKENRHLQQVNQKETLRNYRLLATVGFLLTLLIGLYAYHKQWQARTNTRIQALRREQQALHAHSRQHEEENNRQIERLRQQLSADQAQQTQLKRQIMRLQTENKRIRLWREDRSIKEEQLQSSAIYRYFHEQAGNPSIDKEAWEQLRTQLDETYDDLTHRLRQLHMGISEIELRICYLVKLSIKVTDMAQMLCRTKSAISIARSRLYKKLTGKEGSASDLDTFISEF